MDLKEELKRLDAELAQAEADRALLVARIEGLTAQRNSLAEAVHHIDRADPTSEQAAAAKAEDLASFTKNDAIVEVLRRSQTPLRIKDIVQSLTDAGRQGETYNGISVYLDGLLKQQRVRRVQRGLYEATR